MLETIAISQAFHALPLTPLTTDFTTTTPDNPLQVYSLLRELPATIFKNEAPFHGCFLLQPEGIRRLEPLTLLFIQEVYINMGDLVQHFTMHPFSINLAFKQIGKKKPNSFP